MKGTRVAARYAKSLLDLALEQGVLENVYQDMKLLSDTCRNSREFSVFLKSPVLKTDKKQSVFRELFGGKLHHITLAFINIITSRRREGYLEAISNEFVSQYRRHKNILSAVITSAIGIDDQLRKKILDIVKSGTNREVVLEERMDKGLIGGFVLKVGDRQIDASILRKIRMLKRTFSENPYVKEF